MTENTTIVNHWCPRSGKQILLDTSRSKSCVDCKFAVHKLVYTTPAFVQYVFLAHVVSVVFFLYYIFVEDMSLLLIALAVFAFDFAFYCWAKWKITQKKKDVQDAKLKELRNWAMRKQ